MAHVIEVIVSPAGDTTIQTHGFKGAECLEASKFLEQSLGTVAHERKTTEFYQSTHAEAHIEH